jgi:hypothetical protein
MKMKTVTASIVYRSVRPTDVAEQHYANDHKRPATGNGKTKTHALKTLSIRHD